MNDYVQPWPKTEEELVAAIRDALGQVPQIDEATMKASYGWNPDPEARAQTEAAYQASADALWKCALAAFNYAGHVVGATGFQASYADLHLLRHTRGIKGPFALFKADDLLFPQYDVSSRMRKTVEEWGAWTREQAQARLAEYEAAEPGDRHVAPAVLEHWRRLARG